MIILHNNLCNYLAIVPICWLLPEDQGTSKSPLLTEPVDLSPEDFADEDSVMDNLNDSDDLFQGLSNEADSDNISLIPVSYVQLFRIALRYCRQSNI